MKNLLVIYLNFIMLLSFAQCKSVYEMEEKSYIEIGKAYYQNWVSGIPDGGSGVNLYIPIIENPRLVELDSVYFRGRKSSLEMVNDNLSVARFNYYKKKDMIMSNEPYAEYGNEAPKFPQKSKLDLKDDECVISYSENNKTEYLKLEGIAEKETLYYPSAPPKN